MVSQIQNVINQGDLELEAKKRIQPPTSMNKTLLVTTNNIVTFVLLKQAWKLCY